MSGIFLAFFYLHNIIDAGRRAALYNQALQGGAPITLPSDMEVPGMRGSLFGGFLLIVAGGILLLNTRFDVPLEWVEEWWPLFVIAIGAWLVYKNFEGRLKEGAAAKDRRS
jgi:hypothetical protein